MKIDKHQRQILRVYGYAISKIAGLQTNVGLFWNARDDTTKVPYIPQFRSAILGSTTAG